MHTPSWNPQKQGTFHKQQPIFAKNTEGPFASHNKGFPQNQPGMQQNKSQGLFQKQAGSPFGSGGGSAFPKQGAAGFPQNKSGMSVFKSSTNQQKAFPGVGKSVSSPFTGGTPASGGLFPQGQKSAGGGGGGVFGKQIGPGTSVFSSKVPGASQPTQASSPFSGSKAGVAFPKKDGESPSIPGWGAKSNNQGNLFKPQGQQPGGGIFNKPSAPKVEEVKGSSPFQSSQAPAPWQKSSSASPFNKPAEQKSNNAGRGIWGDKGKQSFVPHVTKPPSANEPRIEEVKEPQPSGVFGKQQKEGGIFQKSASPFGQPKAAATEVKKDNNGAPNQSLFSKPATGSVFGKKEEQKVAAPAQPSAGPFGKSAPPAQEKKEEAKNIFNKQKEGQPPAAKPSSVFGSNSQAPQSTKAQASSLFGGKDKPQEKSASGWAAPAKSAASTDPPKQAPATSSQAAAGTPFSKGVSADIFKKKEEAPSAAAGPAAAPQQAAAGKKEEYRPPQAVISQQKEEAKKEDPSDYFKKLRLKEYVRLMRDMLFMKGPQQFTEIVEMVDQTERKVERLLEQEEVITQQIRLWIAKRRELEECLFHQEQMLDSVMTRTKEVISELQGLDAFEGQEHVFKKILQLMETDEDEEEADIEQQDVLYGQQEDGAEHMQSIVSEHEFNQLLRDLIVGNGEEKCASSIKILMMYEQSAQIQEELKTVSASLGSGLHRKLLEWGKAKQRSHLDEQVRCLQLFTKFYAQLDSLNASIESNQEKLKEAIRIKQKLDAQGYKISTLFG